ncbi:MAG TPA: POTRA domain-containing protein, partial [Flavisolibacter sp.]|nr:POTRA domain-containing protein [Flavisolibacter sp.]
MFLIAEAVETKAQEITTDLSSEKDQEIMNRPVDSTENLLIKEISISGNKRTRIPTILRELSVQEDDKYSLQDLVHKLELSKQQLMNTSLFRHVNIDFNTIENEGIVININVEERWYLYPIPFVKAVDDNFSKWWKEDDRRLDQLNYGIRLTQKNFTGRNDRLTANLMNGYTKQILLEYRGLYLDKEMKWYSNVSMAVGKNREVIYQTRENKQLGFKNSTGFIHSFSRMIVDVIYRPAIRGHHTFSFGYLQDRVADTIIKLNSNFASRSASTRFPTFGYSFSFNAVDFSPYPTKGIEGAFSLSRLGVNSPISVWHLDAKASSNWKLGANNFINLKFVGILKVPFNQPYIMQRFLGSGGYFLQGYEDYVVDGVAGGYSKASYHYQIVNKTIRMPENKFRMQTSVPFRVYLKTFANAGYVHNPNTTLHNALNN